MGAYSFSRGALITFSFERTRKLSSCSWEVTVFIKSASLGLKSSSETQGQSVGSGKKAGRKFSSKGGRAPGYRLSPNYFQKFKRMPAPDWAQKMLCIIVPNRRTISPELFS